MASRVLIVDDDPLQCRLLEGMVRALGHACESVGGGEAALARLGASSAPQISAMILDLVMPDLDGMAVLERLGRRSLWVPVIVQTASGGVDAAVSAMRAGAFDFVVKPVAPERLRVSLANALKVGALAGEVSRMSRSRAGTLEFADIVMRSAPMERVRDLGRRAARLSAPVLIEGETGTGKDIFARAIHGSSPRRTRPFVSVNCAAIARDAAEAVLFGEADGAFGLTRAGGKLKEAQGGTLFLDEVGALPPSAQRRLVGVVQGEEGSAPGAKSAKRGDVRLIVATRRRLLDLVTEGSFREDAFYALSTFPIWLPPLRERRSDIGELARVLLARLAAEAGRPDITGLTPEALALLCAHDWPGNVRQLEGALFRAVALCEGGEVSPHDFPQIQASIRPSGQGRWPTRGRILNCCRSADRCCRSETDWPAKYLLRRLRFLTG